MLFVEQAESKPESVKFFQVYGSLFIDDEWFNTGSIDISFNINCNAIWHLDPDSP